MPSSTSFIDIERCIGITREPTPAHAVLDAKHALLPPLIAAFHVVYRELGGGLEQSLYVRALATELAVHELTVVRDAEFPAYYRGCKIGSCRIDLLVDRRILLAVRASPAIDSSDRVRLYSTWRCSRLESALLLNFGMRPDFECWR